MAPRSAVSHLRSPQGQPDVFGAPKRSGGAASCRFLVAVTGAAVAINDHRRRRRDTTRGRFIFCRRPSSSSCRHRRGRRQRRLRPATVRRCGTWGGRKTVPCSTTSAFANGRAVGLRRCLHGETRARTAERIDSSGAVTARASPRLTGTTYKQLRAIPRRSDNTPRGLRCPGALRWRRSFCGVYDRQSSTYVPGCTEK